MIPPDSITDDILICFILNVFPRDKKEKKRIVWTIASIEFSIMERHLGNTLKSSGTENWYILLGSVA
jgi:hypothetical protein